jgi:toxin ParE1/3/4
MVEVNWTACALEDLEDIAQYISKDSIKYAKLTIRTLFFSTDILSKTPKIGRLVPEFKNPLIREIIRGNYRIVYKIVSVKKIDILTVHHCARHLSAESL